MNTLITILVEKERREQELEKARAILSAFDFTKKVKRPIVRDYMKRTLGYQGNLGRGTEKYITQLLAKLGIVPARNGNDRYYKLLSHCSKFYRAGKKWR